MYLEYELEATGVTEKFYVQRVGYMDLHIYQNSSNCTSRICVSVVCKLSQLEGTNPRADSWQSPDLIPDTCHHPDGGDGLRLVSSPTDQIFQRLSAPPGPVYLETPICVHPGTTGTPAPQRAPGSPLSEQLNALAFLTPGATTDQTLVLQYSQPNLESL